MSYWDRRQIKKGWTDERMREFKDQDFNLEADSFLEWTTDQPKYTAATRNQIIGWKPDLWWIPTTEDLLKVKEFIDVSPDAEREHFYLATAVTIQFLNQLPPTTRRHLRKLVIEENRPSVADPYMHAHGLIPFCRYNPQLRVERRVDL